MAQKARWARRTAKPKRTDGFGGEQEESGGGAARKVGKGEARSLGDGNQALAVCDELVFYDSFVGDDNILLGQGKCHGNLPRINPAQERKLPPSPLCGSPLPSKQLGGRRGKFNLD